MLISDLFPSFTRISLRLRRQLILKQIGQQVGLRGYSRRLRRLCLPSEIPEVIRTFGPSALNFADIRAENMYIPFWRPSEGFEKKQNNMYNPTSKGVLIEKGFALFYFSRTASFNTNKIIIGPIIFVVQ